MVSAVRVHQLGGPEVLKYEEVELPPPGPGQVRVKTTAVGVNYIDTYFRTGLYPSPSGLPFIVGNESAGVVTALGSGVKGLKKGDRVAAVFLFGAYATERNLPAERVVKLPPKIDDKTGAAMLLKGMTAQYLLRRCYKVKKGDNILVHAAAGGVGLILCQWAKFLGATVIGTVGTKEKADLARKNGAHHTILYNEEDWVKRVGEITKGKKCEVVYDGVGKTTFMKSLDCLKPLGLMVSYGNASGAVEPLNLGLLTQKGSLFVTRPTLNTYTAAAKDLQATAKDLINVIVKKKVRIEINQTYALKDAERAHRDLESRKTTGQTVLLP
jgi:NADPH2:quinone reductase